MICYDSTLAMMGKIYYGRRDPDAVSYQRNDQAPRNYLISAIARTDHPHERVILDEIGYQLHQGITALITWQIRTVEELRDHFGMWKSPDKHRRRQAA